MAQSYFVNCACYAINNTKLFSARRLRTR